jgi:DNA-binding NtrC family response regulator
MWNILVVDDEKGVGYSFRRVFKQPDYNVDVAHSAEEMLAKMPTVVYDLIILDIQMPGMSGLEALHHIQKIDPKVPIIFITAFGAADTAIEAMRQGAYDFVLKPFDIPAMKQVIDRALDLSRQLRMRVVMETPNNVKLDEDRMIGRNPKMQEIYKQIGQVAATDVPVLIRGESGTGKELVARAVYQHSRRSDKSFLTVNCAAIPEALLESELFGYEKGAFTGAVQRRIGKFEQASGGTIFLDEIGDMALATQAKILRLLQEQTFERLGGNTTLRADVRVIAATNQNLERAIEEKTFREDLYYRLNVVTVTIPPLRQRRDDVPRLVEYFVARFRAELGKHDLTLAREAIELLSAYDWPGNVRELQNILKNAALMSKGNLILPESLSISSFVKVPLSQTSASFVPFSEHDLDACNENLYNMVIPEVERRLITYVLKRTGGNQVKTAQLLGISRMMLRERMERYGITIETQIDDAS